MHLIAEVCTRLYLEIGIDGFLENFDTICRYVAKTCGHYVKNPNFNNDQPLGHFVFLTNDLRKLKGRKF